MSHKYIWSFDDCDTTFRICFCTLITTSLLFCSRRFIWAVGTLLYRSVLLTQINTNIVARSDLYCLFWYFTCPETSFMFGEQEVLIPSMLLCSLCDSLNSSRFVVVRTSNMAASIHWPASCSRVSKNRSGYPLVWRFRLLNLCCTL